MWPFFSLGTSGGYTHEASFDANGPSMMVHITNPAGNSAVFGANVLPARSFVAGGSQALAVTRAMVGMGDVSAIGGDVQDSVQLVSVGVPAQSELNFPGRPRGYVLQISKQQWNHPVTYILRDATGATIAAGQVRPGQADFGRHPRASEYGVPGHQRGGVAADRDVSVSRAPQCGRLG